MQKILVTGGLGYIGSHTIVELQEAGFEVLIVDNLSNSELFMLEQIEKITDQKSSFEKLDLRNFERLDNFLAQNQDIQAVIHFAALKAVGESVQKPLEYYENNITSLLNLLKLSEKYQISNFVFSSSCTVYGQPQTLPVNEEAPFQKAESPYGNTKQIAEDILRDFCKINPKFNNISLRYFNPVGSHSSAIIGELPKGIPNNLLPFITQTAIGIRQELKVFGNDYNTPDGSCIRDYIHVSDLAKAHVVACKRLLEKDNDKNYEYFNLGTGKGSSVLEVIKTFEAVSQEKLNYKIVERREGDIEQIYADTQLANQVLGWKAEKTLSEMLLSAWNWEKYYRTHFLKEK